MSSKYCPKAHDSIHFTPDGKVTMCCLQAGANFDWPKTSDIDFNDMNAWYKNHPKFKEIRELLPKHVITLSTSNFNLKSPIENGKDFEQKRSF